MSKEFNLGYPHIEKGKFDILCLDGDEFESIKDIDISEIPHLIIMLSETLIKYNMIKENNQ